MSRPIRSAMKLSAIVAVALPGLAALAATRDVTSFGAKPNDELDDTEINRNPAEAIELGGAGLDQLSFVNNVIGGNGFASVSGNPGAALEWANNTVTGNGENRQLVTRGFASPRPVADFTSPAKAVAGEPIRFVSQSHNGGAGIAHALWDFGEGIPSTGAEVAHTFTRAGTYRVTLIVWDTAGRGAIKERSLKVSP